MPAGRPLSLVCLVALFACVAISRPARATPADASVPDPCGSEVLLESQMANDPELAARRALLESMVKQAQDQGLLRTNTTAATIYTIPVVFHIVHDGGPENISYAQVKSQIAAINRDCQNLPANGLPAADCQLQFCLATNLPQNSTVQWANPLEPGVTRKQISNPTVVFGSNASDAALKAIDYLPSDQYLNVWVVRQITGGSGSVVGYATFPGSVPLAFDGIVMDYRFTGADGMGFGTFSTLMPNYNEGKVFAHEVGHWLDLFHTFHGGCSLGDQVADTPPQGVNAWGCPTTIPSTCTANGGDPIHNFMDYTNDPCRWQFTGGQKTRMHAAITTYRSKLVSQANLVTTGACAPSLFAVVNLSSSQGCVNTPIPVSAPNCSGSCTYTWSFPGGVGNPSGQNSSVTYGTPGIYTVNLSMSDGNSTSNASATVYVSACTPVTGACTNWVWSSKCRLSFATGTPVPVTGTLNQALETASQISGSNGALLFYSDGSQVWTAANTVMPNGTGIIGGNSSHNGSLILPVPGSTSTYFLFAVRQWEDGPKIDPLHYSVVNMNLNGGLGDVATAFKNVNIPLPGTPQRLIEAMTVIPQCNGTDWWLITHGADALNGNNDWNKYIYVTPITSAGPGVSTAYPIGLGGPGTLYSAWGALTASKDGSKFAVIQSMGQAIGVYNFNRVTGVPTLMLNTGDIDANHDLAFSPNGQILYYCYLNAANNRYGLRQYDLGSQQYRTITAPLAGGDYDVRLGPDDKIYVAPGFSSSLHCVNFPDQFNTTANPNACGFNPNSIPLPAGGGTTEYGTLPNLLPICSASAAPAAFTYTVTNCSTVQFTSPNCGPWSWNFGDGGNSTLQSPSHTFAAGTWTVTLTATNAFPTTIQKTLTIGMQPIAIAGPNPACGGPFNYSAVGPSNYQYSWTITGGQPATATGNNVFVNWGLSSGTVTLTATDPATGCVANAFMGVEACMTCTQPPAGMRAWWPLDEFTGTSAQEIVAANDGQDVSVGSPAKVAGAVAMGRQFDGTTSVIRVNDHAKLDPGTGDLTLDAWIQTSSTALQGIVEKRLLSPDRGYALYLKQGKPALLLGDGSAITEYWASSSSSLADGQWHHVAATENRSDNAAGTRLYVDGALIATFPGYASTASLTNIEKLVIGAQEPASAPTGWFAGRIDEVELFARALNASEIAAVWGAGAAGKCKEFIKTPGAQTFCTADPTDRIVTLNVCNLGTTAQSFNLTFAGVGGPGCAGPQPNSFQILGQSGNLVPVPPGNCTTVQVKIGKPLGMGNGDVSCYQITATNTQTNVAHLTRGTLWASDALCPRVTSSGGTPWGGVGTTTPATWSLKNTSASVRAVPVFVEMHPDDESEPGPYSFVSLNGLPPGQPWFTNYVLAPGESVMVNVDAQFLEARPFRFHDLVLYADSDGDFVPDVASSIPILYDERAPQVTDVPEPVSPGVVRLFGVRPNPLPGQGRVEFDLPRVGWVKLALYDVSGRRVRTVAEGLLEPGHHSRPLDVRGLGSGVYFLRLDANGESRTQRVVRLGDGR